jgi:hypothetical protein
VSVAKMAHGFGGDAAEGEFEVRPGNGTSHIWDPSHCIRDGGTKNPARVRESDRRRCLRADLKPIFRKSSGSSSTKRTFFLVRLPLSLYVLPFLYLHRTGPDFIDQTFLLLSDIAAARGKPVPAVVRENRNKSQAPTPFDYCTNDAGAKKDIWCPGAFRAVIQKGTGEGAPKYRSIDYSNWGLLKRIFISRELYRIQDQD